jgi:hypothetical protein
MPVFKVKDLMISIPSAADAAPDQVPAGFGCPFPTCFGASIAFLPEL